MDTSNPVLEEYSAAIINGRRTFGVLLYLEELTYLKDLGLDNYETEPGTQGRLYVTVYIKTG